MSKDRQNWAGKTPKRALFHGAPSPFNWESEAELIQDAKETQLARTSSCGSDYINLSIASGTETESDPDSIPFLNKRAKVEVKQEEKKTKFQVDWLSTCHECKIAVWIGPEEHKVSGVCLACPDMINWEETTQDPYCAACWQKENDFLEGMSAAHKAKGKKER